MKEKKGAATLFNTIGLGRLPIGRNERCEPATAGGRRQEEQEKQSQNTQVQDRHLGHPAPGDTILKLIASPNLEYKNLTAKVENAA